MNSIEKNIHTALSRWPIIKDFIKILYQMVFTITSNRKNHITCNVIKKFDNAFVGFHDVKCYCSHSGQAVFHKVNTNKRPKITVLDTVKICVYNFETDKTKVIESTRAFNWQMGSRLQILSSGDIVWNAIENNSLKSKLFKDDDIHSQKYSIYSVSGAGIAATVNFANIEKYMPGYGYVGNFTEDCERNEILIWDLINSIKLKSIKLEQLSEKSFITHLQFSPGGDFIAFFIRESSDHYNFSTELVVYDWRTGKMIGCTRNLNVITHFTWFENLIIMFCLYKGKFQYVIYDISLDTYSTYSSYQNLPDGHPNFLHGSGMVTDTYPDRRRRQKIYFNSDMNIAPNLIGEFYSPLYYRGYSRVDLHPRLHENGVISIDCIDSAKISTLLLKST